MEISKHSSDIANTDNCYANNYDKINNINTASNGLSNLGNTCFFNSILQLLFQCTVLNKLILSNNFTANTANTANTISHYSDFLRSYINSKSSYVEPNNIVNYVSNFLGRRRYQQEDAEQYLNYIIDSLIDELKEFTKQKSLGNTLISNKNLTLDELINCLFTIKIKKTLQCPCSNKSESDDDINKLYLSINQTISECTTQTTSGQSLQNLIQKYIFETLDDDNKWKCDKCNNKVNATITRQILKLPKYLIIVLKRYNNDNRKDDTCVDMPIDMDINNKSYYLRGIVYHSGSTGGGHYVYYGKHGHTNNWFLYNDSSVSQINDSTLFDIKKRGYIYLYVAK